MRYEGIFRSLVKFATKTSLSLILALLFSVKAGFAENVPEPQGDGPEGYRQGDFRAPVPAPLKGARVVDAAAAHALWEKGQAIFIDVLPRPPQPKNIQDPTKWKLPKRLDIEGSVWLPNVGFGQLHPSTEDYFTNNLARLSGGVRERAIVFYCLANCWMSWNAAKRAIGYGYTNVIWFPGGSDDWAAAGYPLEEKLPEE